MTLDMGERFKEHMEQHRRTDWIRTVAIQMIVVPFCAIGMASPLTGGWPVTIMDEGEWRPWWGLIGGIIALFFTREIYVSLRNRRHRKFWVG